MSSPDTCRGVEPIPCYIRNRHGITIAAFDDLYDGRAALNTMGAGHELVRSDTGVTLAIMYRGNGMGNDYVWNMTKRGKRA